MIAVPYKRVGNVVYHKKGGKWSVKARCRSASAAEAQVHLLQGVEHGWKPTGKKRKG